MAGTPPAAAAALGLGDVLAVTQLKLLASLPAELRAQAAAVRERFHLDPSGWEHRPDEPPFLPVVVQALWDHRRLRVTYRRWGPKDVERTLDPLGVVLKVGNWYLVARSDGGSDGGSGGGSGGGSVRTYHVGRLQAVEVLAGTFERPAGFDLAAAWEASQAGYAERVFRHWIDVRISPAGLQLVGLFGTYPAEQARAHAGPPDADGWVTTRVPLETQHHAEHWVLRLGAEAEVLGPPTLRERMVGIARQLAARYAPEPLGAPEPPGAPVSGGGTSAG